MYSFPQFTRGPLWGEFVWGGRLFTGETLWWGGNFLVVKFPRGQLSRGQLSGGQFSSGAIVRGAIIPGQSSKGQLSRSNHLRGNYPGGGGSNNPGVNFPRGNCPRTNNYNPIFAVQVFSNPTSVKYLISVIINRCPKCFHSKSSKM